MSVFVMVTCAALNAYWMTRTLTLLRGSEQEIAATLGCDLWWGRRLWSAFRTAFLPTERN